MPYMTHEEAILCLNQTDALIIHGADMLAMLPAYGIYNERGMEEMRRAICAFLGIEITDEQATDACGWGAFIEPHISTIRNEVYDKS